MPCETRSRQKLYRSPSWIYVWVCVLDGGLNIEVYLPTQYGSPIERQHCRLLSSEEHLTSWKHTVCAQGMSSLTSVASWDSHRCKFLAGYLSSVRVNHCLAMKALSPLANTVYFLSNTLWLGNKPETQLWEFCEARDSSSEFPHKY